MIFRLTSALFVLGTVALAGCGSSGPSNRFDPPNTDFAGALGIVTPPPVTSDQAMAIAAQATGGTALSVSEEREGGQLFFEVQVETSSGRKEVEVRASDGGVVEIEAADND
jgi:Peptidase propeptide and YPEB domain